MICCVEHADGTETWAEKMELAEERDAKEFSKTAISMLVMRRIGLDGREAGCAEADAAAKMFSGHVEEASFALGAK